MELKKLICWIVFAAFIAITNAAHAGNYTIYGIGGNSCGEWVTGRSNNSWYQMGQWLQGFLSAVSYYEVHDLKKIDSQSLALWMDNYCRENPLEDFEKGVRKLVDELRVSKKAKTSTSIR